MRFREGFSREPFIDRRVNFALNSRRRRRSGCSVAGLKIFKGLQVLQGDLKGGVKDFWGDMPLRGWFLCLSKTFQLTSHYYERCNHLKHAALLLPSSFAQYYRRCLLQRGFNSFPLSLPVRVLNCTSRNMTSSHKAITSWGWHRMSWLYEHFCMMM